MASQVLVFEDNLLWSSRLLKSLQALGHEPLLLKALPETLPNAPIAIVNLGSAKIEPVGLVKFLKAAGVFVIGHAGHKEKDLHELGRQAGCDLLASNSEITFKLDSLLKRANLSSDENSEIQ